MQRWFFKSFYFAMAVISIVALSKIFAGQVYTRDSAVNSQSNSSSWPFEVRLHLTNHVCTIPSPNLDLSGEKLIAAWQLPLKTRLSDRMREIASWRLAAGRIWPLPDFDPSVDSWPIGLVAVLIVCACFNIHRFLFGLSTSKNEDDGFKLCKIAAVSFCGFFIWYVLHMLLEVMPVVHVLSYMLYGRMEPRSYFSFSSDWKLVAILVYVGYYATVVECLHRCMSFLGGYEFVGKMIKGCFVPKVKEVASLVSMKRSVDEVKKVLV